MIHVLRASIWKIRSSTFANEKRVSCEDFSIKQKANAIRRVSRRVDHLYGDFSDIQNGAVIDRYIFPGFGYSVGNDLGSENTLQNFVSCRVVSVTMCVNYVVQLQFLIFDELSQRVLVTAGVYNNCFSG